MIEIFPITQAPKNGEVICGHWFDGDKGHGFAFVYWDQRYSDAVKEWAFSNSGSFCRTPPDGFSYVNFFNQKKVVK